MTKICIYSHSPSLALPPNLPPLWSSFSELSKILSLRLQSWFCPKKNATCKSHVVCFFKVSWKFWRFEMVCNWQISPKVTWSLYCLFHSFLVIFKFPSPSCFILRSILLNQMQTPRPLPPSLSLQASYHTFITDHSVSKNTVLQFLTLSSISSFSEASKPFLHCCCLLQN